ncbi:enoyl-CoA hydratase-related protein, partial [Sphingomonas sanguinis]|uniref:enoyl-CoA hydratase-related protein n=1 Tax=Sphingomonas sanguinis TaxID=33051 RepID=UPI00187BF1F4
MDGPVAVLTLRNPPNNHLGVGTISALADAFDAVDADPAVRSILLRSDGRVFCAGADLVNANPVADPLPPGARSPFYMAAARLFGVQTPVVAAVQGAAVGAWLLYTSDAADGLTRGCLRVGRDLQQKQNE